MRTSLRKLRVLGGGGGGGAGGTHHSSKHGAGCFKDRKDLMSFNQLDELDHASQDLEDMKDCYDNLLSAAAATTNSAYEFSESLRELGACLLQKTALSDDEDSGKVLLMLGKVQYELQRLLDIYRSHITRTITIPSQSLLNELRTVEEMKHQCDEKRSTYEYMISKQKDKCRSKSGKGENFSMQQLQDAHEQFDEEATLFMFRLKSLKQGQSRSLLTQAARHHAAQLSFFKKALKSLEGVEPHVEYVTEQQHIDYPFDGLEDEDDDDNDMDDESYDTNDDGELSFDYAQSHTEGVTSSVQQSMELDQSALTFPSIAAIESSKEFFYRNPGENLLLGGGTQSAPLLAERKSDSIEKPIPTRQFSTRKLQTYVLPTPVGNTKISYSSTSVNRSPPLRQSSLNWRNQKLWHSTPLEPKRPGKSPADAKHSRNLGSGSPMIVKESNQTVSSPLPPPLKEGFPFAKQDPFGGLSYKKMRRQSFSGPLSNKQHNNQHVPGESPLLYSGSTLRSPVSMSQPFSSPPKVSPVSSPPLSSPKISELHELPRPPINSCYAPSRPARFGYSAPLVSRGKERDISGKHDGALPTIASPLPIPPMVVSRSLSIPTSASRGLESLVPKSSDMPQNSETSEKFSSPPLTPISLPRIRLPTNLGTTQPVTPLGGTN